MTTFDQAREIVGAQLGGTVLDYGLQDAEVWVPLLMEYAHQRGGGVLAVNKTEGSTVRLSWPASLPRLADMAVVGVWPASSPLAWLIDEPLDSRLRAIVNRTRALNHPGHPNQKVHGGKGGAADAQISKLDRIDPPGDARTTAMGTNPGYGGSYQGPVTPELEAAGGASYTQNCTRVAIAYELRRRGVDVTAGAGSPAGETTAAYVRTFRQDGKYGTRVAEDLSRNMSVKEVAAEVETWPHGARGIVTIQGHTVNVERDAQTGKATFVDAQAARNKNPVMSRAQFEARVKSRGAPTDKHAAVARVDDLDVSDYSLRYVESSKLDVSNGQPGRTEYPTPDPGRYPSFDEIATMTPDDSYP